MKLDETCLSIFFLQTKEKAMKNINLITTYYTDKRKI